jgi:hypothetical protein
MLQVPFVTASQEPLFVKALPVFAVAQRVRFVTARPEALHLDSS